MLNMASASYGLAEELALSPAILASIQELEDRISDLFDPSKYRTSDRPGEGLSIAEIAETKQKAGVEIDVVFGEKHKEAFEVSYGLIITRMPLQVIDDKGQHLSGDALIEFLSEPLPYEAVLDGLEEILAFCQKQAIPPIPLSEISIHTEKFRTQKLVAKEVESLREKILVEWPPMIENYYNPISKCDAKTVEERSGLMVEQLLSQAFRLGSLIGMFSIFLKGKLAPSTDPEFRQNSYRIDFLLQRMSIPVNIEEFRQLVVNHKMYGNDQQHEMGPTIGDRYYYEVFSKTERLLSCFYGNLVSNLFTLGYRWGELEPFLNFVTSSLAELDESINDDWDRSYVSAQISKYQTQLRQLPISESILQTADEAFGKWRDPESDPEAIQQAGEFLVANLNEIILTDVIKRTAAQGAVVPHQFEHLAPYLSEFLADNPDYEKNVLVMMRFRDTEHFLEITDVIRNVLGGRGMRALRADDKDYTGDLWTNVCVYLLGCKYGIAVFEEIDEREFNPNIALELGFMIANGKRVLILKDQRMTKLPTDIVGKLYKSFDTYHITSSVTKELKKWLYDLGLGAP